jgi:hypothetical protein
MNFHITTSFALRAPASQALWHPCLREGDALARQDALTS